ncbi:hypothetical protein HMPREF1981_00673 [Bacteroides pyogenes F0041]|uniref:Uncharacterized protein n=1 Tax=Bacteroides pyogenes F0041 TaxID=1321819 RepID=U2CCS4_9BACE|nr:hypothetical protein [Bacteroides pyogenes]ERI88289.1 hypothetical protein HMPREF1981_00673 [Bacteroides pyogenes F0041]
MANICTNLFFCSTENKENLKTVENYMTDTFFGSIFSITKSSTCCLRSRSADNAMYHSPYRRLTMRKKTPAESQVVPARILGRPSPSFRSS